MSAIVERCSGFRGQVVIASRAVTSDAGRTSITTRQIPYRARPIGYGHHATFRATGMQGENDLPIGFTLTRWLLRLITSAIWRSVWVSLSVLIRMRQRQLGYVLPCRAADVTSDTFSIGQASAQITRSVAERAPRVPRSPPRRAAGSPCRTRAESA